jgi:two-component system sporulation sensor kinase B
MRQEGVLPIDILQDIFLNFLIVLSPLFFYHSVFSSTSMGLKEQLRFGLICSVATVLCMQFPIVYGETFLWDLRWIPFIASILYGGLIPGVITGVCLLVFRFLLGGYIAWFIVLITALILYATFIWLRKKFLQQPFVNKLIYGFLSALYTYLISFAGIYIYFVYLDNTKFLYQQGASLYIVMSISYLMTMFIFIYFTENFMINLKIQEKVHQAEKLNLISDLAASMAHEVRNPLTVVRGFIQLLRNKLGEQEKEYIEISISELDRAESIITDYLSFAKPQLDMNEKIQVSPLLHELLIMISPYANMQEVEITKRIEENLIMYGDMSNFKQVILNILKNAIEATKDCEQGGVHISAWHHNQTIHITISDDGVGMTPDELSRIGKPFYTTKSKGTGLGMMVTLRLVEALRGSIHIHSTELKGTEVVLHFPSYVEPASGQSDRKT